MEAEKQHITSNERTIHPIYSKNSLSIQDNRPLAAAQAKMLGVIQMCRKKKGASTQHTPPPPADPMDAILDHIMKGDVDNLKGLHAYTDGDLPDNVEKLDQVGASDTIHEIWWRKQHSTELKCKWSTMFYKDLNRDIIKRILDKAQQGGTQFPRDIEVPDDTQQRFVSINRAGNGYYPVIRGADPPQKIRQIGGQNYQVTW